MSERPSEKKVFFLNSQQAEFLKLRVHFWLLFLSMFEFYPASIRNGKIMSFSYLNIELYYSAIENFHTFVYIYRAVRVTAKATDFNYFFFFEIYTF